MIAGVDEAGRGPVIGPLVIAIVATDTPTDLTHLGLRDSKTLTPKKRENLAKEIKKIASHWKVLTIPASDIDTMRRTMTLNQLEVYAFSKVINTIQPPICYVDSADVKEQRFADHILAQLTYKPTIISEHKADARYPIVSAASIIAKTIRDELVADIEKQLSKQLSLPMGSGYPADPITKEFLRAWVNKYHSLPPQVRHSWKTSQTLLQHIKSPSLDSYR
ncbi:MAG: ribonuclease HII [Candidatus Thermoplasmatota archaeon]|nr:ribonuclease HII [Candidatus Thermoplasmatota archaeon]